MSFEKEQLQRRPQRIEMADPEQMNESQIAIYNKIVSGTRGKLVGPLRVALHSPELADRWELLGEFLRFQTSLPPVISELAIIVTGRFWNCQVEWYIHSGIAVEVGLSSEVVEAVRTAQIPDFDDELQALVYEFSRELLEFAQVGDDIYKSVHQLIGTASIVELTAVIGYYTMVAMTLNAHHVPLPKEEYGSLLDLQDGNRLVQPTRLPRSWLRSRAEQTGSP